MKDKTINEYEKMSHLLRRAGFGANKEEAARYLSKGFDATINELVHFETALPDNEFEKVQDRLQGDFLDFRNFGDLQMWWLQKMQTTDRPLQEKMTLFWHGHFVSAYSKVRSPELMFQQNQLFRKYAVGNFRELTQAVSRNPAMILYLDNQTNRKGHPNENYARELFELFTLGIGNYTEQDIHEAARAFTGWSANRLTNSYVFLSRQHDDESKTVFGKTGSFSGNDVVDMAVKHPACAQHICKKLFQFFIHDDPTSEDVRPFANIFTASQFEIKPVLEAMFHSPIFYSEKAVWARIKSPVEFVVGALKSTQAEMQIRDAPQALKAMGQELFNPPNVKGWDGGLAWVNTTTLLARFNFALRLAKLNESNQPLLQDLKNHIEKGEFQSPEQLVDYFADHILHRPLSQHSRTTLAAYLKSEQPQNRITTNHFGFASTEKVHGLMHIMMLTPEYQLV